MTPATRRYIDNLIALEVERLQRLGLRHMADILHEARRELLPREQPQGPSAKLTEPARGE